MVTLIRLDHAFARGGSTSITLAGRSSPMDLPPLTASSHGFPLLGQPNLHHATHFQKKVGQDMAEIMPNYARLEAGDKKGAFS